METTGFQQVAGGEEGVADAKCRVNGSPTGAKGHRQLRARRRLQISRQQGGWRVQHPGRSRYSLLCEEILGFPMYLRMGLRFLSSMASLSFFVLLLCWDTREEHR